MFTEIAHFFQKYMASLTNYTFVLTLTLSVGRVQYWTISHLKLNGAKHSGWIFSDQNAFCLCIHFYVFYFLTFAETITGAQKNAVSQVSPNAGC